MLIAKQTENGFDVADHVHLLSNTSFGAGGPTVAQIEELGFYQVTVWKEHDLTTQKLVACAPYLENGQVFTVNVVNKTPEEISADITYQNVVRSAARAEAYRLESDPLFFKAQRGEANTADWLAKVEEIKNRFPTIVEGATPIINAANNSVSDV